MSKSAQAQRVPNRSPSEAQGTVTGEESDWQVKRPGPDDGPRRSPATSRCQDTHAVDRRPRTLQHTACSGSHLHAGSACPGACDQSSHRRNGPSPSRTLTLTDIGEELRSGLRSGLRELLSTNSSQRSCCPRMHRMCGTWAGNVCPQKESGPKSNQDRYNGPRSHHWEGAQG